MPRCNGSYIGFDANPNPNAASGMWTVREAETYLRADKWPATPTVPGAPTAVAGDEEVSLTWTAPTGGSTPTDYIVQYSSDAGSTFETFSDGVSNATSATVTGLTNGQGYIFRIIAVNVLGEGPAGSASGTVTPGVPAALLLNFNGTNGSSTFTDSSPSGLTVTANGDAQISTAESKFGGASGLFDGAGDYLEASMPFDWDGDFTIECWIRRVGDNGGGVGVLLAAGDLSGVNGGVNLYVEDAGAVVWNDGLTGAISAGSAPTAQWVHVAAVRSGGVNTLFVDGVSVGTSAQTFPVGNNVVEIGGADNYGFWYNGYIDDLRVIEGIALYTATFTPPAAELGPTI